MTDLRLTDQLIKTALTPADDGAMAGLAGSISERVHATPQRRFRWPRPSSIFGMSGPSPTLRTVALLAMLALLVLVAVAIIGSRRPQILGNGTMFHGGPARTGEMVGPGPVGQPRLAWQATLDGPLANTMPALAGGRLYVADGRGNVTVYDAPTGARGWTKALPRPAGSPAFAQGLLIVGAGDGVYGLDATSGAERWHLATDAPVLSAPAIDGGSLYVGLPDGSLVALDIASGAERWRTKIGGAITRAPALADGTVVVGGDGGTLAAVRASDGAPVWSVPLGAGQVATPAIRDGIVYATSGIDVDEAEHRLFALRLVDGVTVWTHVQPSGKALFIGAVGADAVYIVGLDGSVFAMRDGVVAWATDIGAPIGSVATLSDGTLYVSAGHSIQALDAVDGHVRWSVSLEGEPGPVIVDGGWLYVGTNLGELVAYTAP